MSMKVLYIIVGGALVTILPRVIPVMFMSKFKLNERASVFLNYIPVSILTALVMAEIFVCNNKITLDSHMILSGIIAIIVAIKKDNLLLTVIAGVASMAILRMIY
ncbi:MULTISPECIES: AzlD domain-containing protein [Clostridium]|uniref:AzlD domain-containing protein n=1 Tax=Clostridium TaxID=1485 RepID=UPI0008266911|nr:MULTISPECIES: AzlD domain-containing protein [Clostridium]PJI09353.1 AzlD domain-containing protein [Clostridium sp. CT7]